MQAPKTLLKQEWFYALVCLAVLINFSSLFIPITGPDGALYAVIAKTMVQHNDYVSLMDHGKDWLDKPHFPFWITALSFKCFGFKTWAYKLPGIIFSMSGALYTYLFAKELYNKQIAFWSVLIFLTAQHIVLSNNDVRAEPYLTGLIIGSVYHFYRAYKVNSFWQTVMACGLAACAIMTKGMFALIPIVGAIGGHLIVTKQWKAMFNWRWLMALVLIMVFIIPEIWCLYQQFDIHPEKIIFGQKGVSGINFFFWDSQFGRFFNTGPIKGSGDPTFFIHTLLWAFLPWSLLLFASIYRFIKNGSKNAREYEWFNICGGLLTFFVFSASQFQLPHYLNIVFPFFAILTAQYLYHTTSAKTIRIIGAMQMGIIVLMLLLISLLHYYFEPQIFSSFTWIVAALLFLWLLFLPGLRNGVTWEKIGLRTLLASYIVNIYLNISFYPSLMHYQAGSEAAIWINNHNSQNLSVAELDEPPYVSAFEFYSNSQVKIIGSSGEGSIPARPFLLYAPASTINSLSKNGWQIQVQSTFERYWITRLKPSFLNKGTRKSELTTTMVVLVK